jgi:hypothetical protein
MSHDDEVGYGKPPKHSQFKKGQSGNLSGRPKYTRNLKTDLTRILGQKISVREGDRTSRVSKQEAMLLSLMAKALKGETRAIAVLVNLVRDIFGLEGPRPDSGQSFTPREREMLAELESGLINRAPAAQPIDDPQESGGDL